MKAAFSIVFIAVSVLLSSVFATRQCNIINLGVEGALPCGLTWWTNEDIGQVITVTEKISDIVAEALDKFGIPLDDINKELSSENLNATTSNGFAKIVESGLVIEPFIVFGIGDAILSTGITGAQLEKFGLPAKLAEKTFLQEMLKEYVDYSCTNHGIKPFVTCLNTWIDQNCVTQDQPDFIKNLLVKMQNFYCDGDEADAAVIDKLDKAMGTIFKPILKFVGIELDDANEFLFDISEDSFIFNEKKLVEMLEVITVDCGAYINTLFSDLDSLINPESKMGAGRLASSLYKGAHGMVRCIVRGLTPLVPTILRNEKLMGEFNYVAGRYSFPEITGAKTAVNQVKRVSSIVYGDPHLVMYNSDEHITCGAKGLNVWLANEFFEFYAWADSAFQDSDATYITYVEIRFPGNLTYKSGETVTPLTYLTNDKGETVDQQGGVEVGDFGKTVRVKDVNSGIIFGFRKYKHTYYFTVRGAEAVFEDSLGILALGCSDEVDATVSRKKRAAADCDAACAASPDTFKDTCLFDCDTTGDTEVGQVSEGMTSLEEEVAEEDEAILEEIAIAQGLPESGGAAGVKVANSLMFFLLALAALIRH